MKVLTASMLGLLLPGAALAATFDLTTASIETAPSFSYTADGIGLTVSDLTFDGVAFNAVSDSDGLAVLDGLNEGVATPPPNTGAGFGQLVDSLTLTFDTAVFLDSVTFGFLGGLEGDETLTFTAASGSVTLNGLGPLGTTSISPLLIQAGEAVSLTGTFGASLNAELVQFSAIDVSIAAVPLPPAAAGMGLGLAALAFMRRRKNKKQA